MIKSILALIASVVTASCTYRDVTGVATVTQISL